MPGTHPIIDEQGFQEAGLCQHSWHSLSTPETDVGARRAQSGHSPGVSGRQVWAPPCSLLFFWWLLAFTCPLHTEPGRAQLPLS